MYFLIEDVSSVSYVPSVR